MNIILILIIFLHFILFCFYLIFTFSCFSLFFTFYCIYFVKIKILFFYSVTFDTFMNILLFFHRSSIPAHLAGSIVVGLLLWLVVIYGIRYTLKLLLIYKGWLFEARGRGSRPSYLTLMWFYLVKLFSGWNKPMLYSFQGSLPRLPLPSVEDTMKRVRFILLFLTRKFN